MSVTAASEPGLLPTVFVEKKKKKLMVKRPTGIDGHVKAWAKKLAGYGQPERTEDEYSRKQTKRKQSVRSDFDEKYKKYKYGKSQFPKRDVDEEKKRGWKTMKNIDVFYEQLENLKEVKQKLKKDPKNKRLLSLKNYLEKYD